MEINDFLGIGIVGTVLSILIQWIKVSFGMESYKTKLLTVLLAIVVGTVYVLFRTTAWFGTVLGILAAASTVYALLLK